MRGEVTPAVQRALTAARSWAVQAGRPRVAVGELLAGLLLEEEGRAALLLVNAGLDLPRYRAALSLPDPTPDPLEIPLDTLAEDALRAASELALALDGERTVSGAALVLTLLRQAEPLRRSLEEHGLDFAGLEQALAGHMLPAITLDEPLDLAPAGQEIDLARLLDASANRTREALRVVEDHCRFVLDDATLARLCKELRHGLQQALAAIPIATLLQGRETLRDVGTRISTPTEFQRESLLDVVRANLKRLQEGLRSLEEFAKVGYPETAGELEQLRYRAYTLERALLLGGEARERLERVRLYALLTGSACQLPLRDTVFALAQGGVDMVQLREKELTDRALLERGRQMREWTRQAGILFIVNDRPDLARAVEADGVHLGQDDLPVKEARRILGTGALVGVSTHNLDQVRQATLDGASYIGVGPAFPSATKSFETVAGLDFVTQALAETTLPAFVIGGINSKTLSLVVGVGATRIAVSHALTSSDTPEAVARALCQQLRNEESGARLRSEE
jgi:thiamine-phosphate pyrophosphorylase